MFKRKHVTTLITYSLVFFSAISMTACSFSDVSYLFKSPAQKQAILHKSPAFWEDTTSVKGSRNLSIDTLLENCTEDIDTRDTSIILLHDSAEKPTTVEALPDIIENILARPDTVILPITENTRSVHHVE